ncbi:hypothetical protein [Kitasatospora sp. MAP5-34]|uniref:hypothetical protein n=1 Tax=Kitasatospora sp. MAP5-34 TaxID=3035102 RepID=UPI0024761595|nr:hypothetical protein [Kitasatospora sp. MAP5-34]MDH6574905.1 hypothetical protein [Kitasatospora sp. MAP5-34]
MNQTISHLDISTTGDEFDLADLDLGALTVVGMNDSATKPERAATFSICSCCCTIPIKLE